MRFVRPSRQANMHSSQTLTARNQLAHQIVGLSAPQKAHAWYTGQEDGTMVNMSSAIDIVLKEARGDCV